jgi:hypothetical protein
VKATARVLPRERAGVGAYGCSAGARPPCTADLPQHLRVHDQVPYLALRFCRLADVPIWLYSRL